MKRNPFSNEEILQYRDLEKRRLEENKRVDELIKNNGVKKTFIIEKTGIPKTTFFYKLRNLSFTIEEINSIAEHVRSDEL